MEALEPVDLPARLKRETHDLHALAERAGAMGELLRGRIDRPTYCALLRNLHAIYEALERALDAHAARDFVKPLALPALRREGRLADDLEALHGGDWRRGIALEPATEAYVERLGVLEREGSIALVAHAYVRYLGDLFGGQVLCRIVRERFALSDEAGTRFYAYGGPERVLELRTAFRSGLAALPIAPHEIDGVVTEARWAFERHRQLFEELRERHLPISA